MRCRFRGKDLIQKIDSTICRYNGVPYYCRADSDTTVRLYPLTDLDGRGKLIDIADEGFDVSSLPLGYYQAGKDMVYYLERKPARRWKQGIDEQGVIFNTIGQGIGKAFGGRGLYSQGFIDSVVGNFPPLHDAIKTLRRKEENSEIAISRDIALQWIADLQIIQVFYRMKLVGFVPPDSMTVTVPSSDMGWIITKYLSSFQWEVR